MLVRGANTDQFAKRTSDGYTLVEISAGAMNKIEHGAPSLELRFAKYCRFPSALLLMPGLIGSHRLLTRRFVALVFRQCPCRPAVERG
jgi:hypothetical protein